MGHVVGRPAERSELAAPALADRPGEVRVLVVAEVLEGTGRGPLLAREQHRRERRGEQQRRGGVEAALAHERRAALTGGAVRSEKDTSELQSLMRISDAVFCEEKN